MSPMPEGVGPGSRGLALGRSFPTWCPDVVVPGAARRLERSFCRRVEADFFPRGPRGKPRRARESAGAEGGMRRNPSSPRRRAKACEGVRSRRLRLSPTLKALGRDPVGWPTSGSSHRGCRTRAGPVAARRLERSCGMRDEADFFPRPRRGKPRRARESAGTYLARTWHPLKVCHPRFRGDDRFRKVTNAVTRGFKTPPPPPAGFPICRPARRSGAWRPAGPPRRGASSGCCAAGRPGGS